jgi:hypothetical protein
LPLISPDKKLWIQYLSTRKGGGVTHYRLSTLKRCRFQVWKICTQKSRTTSSWTWSLRFWRLQNAVVIARPLEAMKWVIHSIFDDGEC